VRNPRRIRRTPPPFANLRGTPKFRSAEGMSDWCFFSDTVKGTAAGANHFPPGGPKGFVGQSRGGRGPKFVNGFRDYRGARVTPRTKLESTFKLHPTMLKAFGARKSSNALGADPVLWR